MSAPGPPPMSELLPGHSINAGLGQFGVGLSHTTPIYWVDGPGRGVIQGPEKEVTDVVELLRAMGCLWTFDGRTLIRGWVVQAHDPALSQALAAISCSSWPAPQPA